MFGPLKALRGRIFASDDGVKVAARTWLRSQTKTFFAHAIRRLVNRYTVCAGGGKVIVSGDNTLHLSQIVVHVINKCIILFDST